MNTKDYQVFISSCEKFTVGDSDAFARLLNMALTELSMLQRQLADFCDVGPSTISRWINDRALPMKRTQLAIVRDLKKYANQLAQEEKRRIQVRKPRPVPA